MEQSVNAVVYNDELQAKYDELLGKMREIDKKYSTDYVDHELNFPDSLGLEEKVFTMPSIEELQEQAALQHQGEYLEKKFEANKDAQENITDTQEESADIVAQAEEDVAKLKTQCNEDSVKLDKSCIDSGLARSSIRENYHQKLITDRDSQIEAVEQQKAQKVAELAQKVISLSQALQDELANIEEVFQAEVTNTTNLLRIEAQAGEQEVIEYNNEIAQKEVEYQFDKEVAIFDASMQEADRAFKAIELLAQMGETGIEKQVIKEKVSLAKSFLAKMPKEDALYLLDTGEELKGHLGDYHAYVVDYIENL